jgi:hypothetical protein
MMKMEDGGERIERLALSSILYPLSSTFHPRFFVSILRTLVRPTLQDNLVTTEPERRFLLSKIGECKQGLHPRQV